MITLATPPITTARLLSRHKAAEGTMAVRFRRPTNWAEEFAATEPILLPDTPYTRREAGVWRTCEKRGEPDRRESRRLEMNNLESDVFVFFGATGDLAYEQIFPGLQAMIIRGHFDMPINRGGKVCVES